MQLIDAHLMIPSLPAQMAENTRGVVVTEGMLTEAALAGDLESLVIWATQGVRVTTTGPLYVAAELGYLEVVRCLVHKLGADVHQVDQHGLTLLIIATGLNNLTMVQCLAEVGADANQVMPNNGYSPLNIATRRGNLAVVRCLVEIGAVVGAMDDNGDTALLDSARNAHYLTMRYLLEEAGADMEDVNYDGATVWHLLIVHLKGGKRDDEVEADSLALTALLRVLVLRGAPPPGLVALLSPEPARVVQDGARLRARLPAYLTHRRAYLDSRCPRISVLPGVLRALIYTFEGPGTTEELWATGLGQAP
jgi:hypothetical protein